MLSEKAYAICLLEILQEYSDAEHILPMREIIAKMQVVYGIKPDRRTIYAAAALLIGLGYDLSVYEENGVGYYLRSRPLEQSEILLLTDAVYAFPFISARQTEQLVQKLQKLLSCHQRKKYRHLTIARQQHKTNNRQVFWNIEQLDEAITRKKKVQMDYLHYGLDKKQHVTNRHTVSPYEMVYLNEHYYLICVPDDVAQTRLFRIDRMANIRLLEEARINKIPARQVENLPAEIQWPINKLLLVGDPVDMPHVEELMQQKFAGKLSIYRSAPFFIETMPLGVEKSASLALLLKNMGLGPENLMACGDGWNDLPMIRYAGMGVAMGNAVPEVKQAAKYVTADNEHDGVGLAVEKFILEDPQ